MKQKYLNCERRNIFTSFLVIFIVITNTLYADIQIHREGGGKDGYNLVTEWDSGKTHNIRCVGPGKISCPMKMFVSEEGINLIFIIDDKISNGISHGNIQTENYFATWKSIDKENTVINIQNNINNEN